MNWKKAVALVVILAMLAGGGYYLLKTEQDDNERMLNLYTEVEPLEREREALATELNGLDVEYATKKRDYATVEVLFTQLQSQIITDVWPVMRERGVVGTLCINYQEIPGYYNKLSAADINRLAADGWGTCVLADSNVPKNIAGWYPNFAKYVAELKIPVPKAVYFANGGYDPSMNEQLAAVGIETVIVDAPDGRSMTVSDTSGIWVTGAMPFGYTGSLADLELLGRTDGGNLALTVKLEETWDRTKSKNPSIASQEKEAFIAMLDSWKDLLYTENLLQGMETVSPVPNMYVDPKDTDALHEMYLESLTPEQLLLLPKFRSVNIERARQLHRSVEANAAALDMERAWRERSLTNKIANLDETIRATYEYYGVGRTEESGQTP